MGQPLHLLKVRLAIYPRASLSTYLRSAGTPTQGQPVYLLKVSQHTFSRSACPPAQDQPAHLLKVSLPTCSRSWPSSYRQTTHLFKVSLPTYSSSACPPTQGHTAHLLQGQLLIDSMSACHQQSAYLIKVSTPPTQKRQTPLLLKVNLPTYSK